MLDKYLVKKAKEVIYVKGDKPQLLKCVEELNELSQAVLKLYFYLDEGKHNEKTNKKLQRDLAKEFKDVEFTMTQVETLIKKKYLDQAEKNVEKQVNDLLSN
jgi:uridine kinase